MAEENAYAETEAKMISQRYLNYLRAEKCADEIEEEEEWKKGATETN